MNNRLNLLVLCTFWLAMLPSQPAIAAASKEAGWFAFEPGRDAFVETSATDLRFLNEKFAGENGWITVKDGRFVHQKTGQPVRFWAVNGPPHELRGEELRRCARLLAKY